MARIDADAYFGWAGVVLLVAGLAGCELPVEPGSDRPDSAPGAKLGPEVDTGADVSAETGTDITGEFDLTADVSSDFGDQTVTIPMRAVVEQSGTIDSGEATAAVELRRADAPEMSGASNDEPAPIDESGAFQTTVTGFEIPADASDMLEEATEADIELDAQVVDDDCFDGETTITMKDVVVSGSTIPEVVLEGPFEAGRVGTTGCGASAGGDTGRETNLDGSTGGG